jgi:tetratricopeptide (TPR) repeat protein
MEIGENRYTQGRIVEDRLGDEAFVAEDGLLAVGLAMHRAARLDLLPPVRDHARRAHPPKGEDATAWCRHFLTLTREQAGRIGLPGGPEALTQLAPEVANLEAAMRAAAGLSLREVAVAAAHGTYLLLSASGAGSIDALRALSQECHIAKDTRGEAGCCFYAGVVAFTRSDHASARALFVRAIPLFQQVGDLGDEADCIRRLGDVAVAREEYSEAQAFFEQSRTLSQKIGDELGEVNCVQSLGEIALRRTDDVAARILFEQALPSYRQLGDVVGEAICIARLGTIALRRADYAGARALYEQGRRLFQQVGDVQGEAGCLLLLGRVARSDGDPAAARTYATRALTIYERLQASQNVAIAHEDLARVTTAAEHAGHVAAARAAWSSIDLPDKAARVDREFG